MLAHPVDLTRLTLLIQRLLDAEILSEREGAPLLTETEAARQALHENDLEAARQHVEHVAFCMKALVQTNLLALADGRAVILVAESILNPMTDAGNEPR